MEDFSTILWTVIIVGAMVLNFVSKSRKARGKGGNEHPQHEEAWPSIPWDNEDEEAAPKTSTAEIPTQKPFSNRPVTAGQPLSEPISVGKETTRSESESGSDPKQPGTGNRPVFADFQGEIQSLEVIPPQVYETSGKEAKTAVSVSEKASGKQPGPKKNESTGRQVRIPSSEEPEAAEITEEFDLRRAVIYSEILKPKFEEL